MAGRPKPQSLYSLHAGCKRRRNLAGFGLEALAART